MSTSSSKKFLDTREEAVKTVPEVLNKTENNFELVNFNKFNKTERLRKTLSTVFHPLS